MKTRDPLRIHQITNKLLAVWYAQPDLRLAQLIFVASTKAVQPNPKDNDIFYVEDDVLEAGLDLMIKDLKL